MNSVRLLERNAAANSVDRMNSARTEYLLAQRLNRAHRDADRIFAVLMAVQWVGGIVAARRSRHGRGPATLNDRA